MKQCSNSHEIIKSKWNNVSMHRKTLNMQLICNNMPNIKIYYSDESSFMLRFYGIRIAHLIQFTFLSIQENEWCKKWNSVEIIYGFFAMVFRNFVLLIGSFVIRWWLWGDHFQSHHALPVIISGTFLKSHSSEFLMRCNRDQCYIEGASQMMWQIGDFRRFARMNWIYSELIHFDAEKLSQNNFHIVS